ncbi:hypothetical protein [Gibbsiella quercinecans]|uniref:hypothetical protein n=1 Tax=Gibbsiella quercinecans TaxID=929813 RepID=UPI000EF14F96|nr:hypothetical protein [Gibbsiella quercinecans]RLM11356.1 hypothetical protein BIY31_05085 [Gibbsiella quercinecans]
MPHYQFYVKADDVRATDGDTESAELLDLGYQKIDFEADTPDKKSALKQLRTRLSENTAAAKNFAGDITFSSIIGSLLR